MKNNKVKESLLPKFSVNRPVTVSMILLAIIVIGSIAYFKIKLDLMPEGFNNPYLSVWVPYRNASPKEIEEQIAKNIEGQLKTVKNLKRVFSHSSSNGCYVFLELSQNANMDLAYSQVTDRMERVKPLLPDEIENYYIYRRRESDIPIMDLAVSYPNDIQDPYYLIEHHIKNNIESISGVANIEIDGAREKYIQIIVDSNKIKAHNLNIYTIVRELLNENFSISAGHSFVGNKKFLVRITSKFDNLDDIKKIEVRKGIKISDVANVVYDFDEEVTSISRLNGMKATTLSIYKESDTNTVEVCKNIEKKIKTIFGQEPSLKDTNYTVFFNQGKLIEESIDNVKESAIWGGFFAFLVLFFFLKDMKMTMMLTLSIPLSLLITILILYFMGWTLNVLTMMGLMLSIGLVVDNSIVITENIYRYNGMGVNRQKASIVGASEVGIAIILATCTTIVVFLPLMIMGGDSNMSFFIVRLGAPVIFSLIASLLIALVIIPVSSLKLLPRKLNNVKKNNHNRAVQWYQTLLVKVLKHKKDFLIILLILILSSAIPFKFMKKSDSSEGGMSDARLIVRFPSSYSMERKDETTKDIIKIINKNAKRYHLKDAFVNIRRNRSKINLYLTKDDKTQWYFVVFKKIKKLLGIEIEHRMSKAELTNDLKEKMPEIPGVTISTSWNDGRGFDSSSLTYTLRGYDTDVLTAISEDLGKQISLVEGVLNIEDVTETGQDEIHLEINRNLAFNLGTSINTIAQTIAAGIRPRKISNYQKGEKEIPVYIKINQEQRSSIAQLRNLLIPTKNKKSVSLDSLTKFNFSKSFGRIRRENGKSFFEIKINLDNKKINDVQKDVENILNKYQFPTGYFYESGARMRRYRDQNTDLKKALLFSIIFIIIIMGILFESFILPLSILIAIPAAFIGSFWLLFATGSVFEVMASIGLIILIGVVVNNGIVLIDLINQYRNSGMNREQAIITAGVNRFRPIFMTALTTICGLIPMALGESSLVGMSYSPLGITMIGGLISSTFLTLFAVPVFYIYFDEMRIFFKNFFSNFF